MAPDPPTISYALVALKIETPQSATLNNQAVGQTFALADETASKTSPSQASVCFDVAGTGAKPLLRPSASIREFDLIKLI